ncbi:hypothetical protein VNO78_17163 [Psophocarpus tetragonolobus]|uniref:Uncharacterized protein n=1 Tax=Psophocarpus tetragonolobus TaxID=3891 RepID=A0AAN9SIR3_PSOTE
MLVGTDDKSTNDGQLSDSKSFEFNVAVDSVIYYVPSTTYSPRSTTYSIFNVAYDIPSPSYGTVSVRPMQFPTYGYATPSQGSWRIPNFGRVERMSNHSSSSKKLLAQKCYCVANITPNIPVLYEAHFRIPMTKSEKVKTFNPPLLIVIGDENYDPKALRYVVGKGAIEYKDFLQSGDPEYAWKPPRE